MRRRRCGSPRLEVKKSRGALPHDVKALSAFSLEERGPGRGDVLVTTVAEPAAVLPLIVIRGESAGPLFIVVAGVHGDEYEGPQAIWQVAQELPPASLRGTLLALPVCNPWAFAAGLRSTPDAIDGANLAREFPGAPGGSPTQRLAGEILGPNLRRSEEHTSELQSRSDLVCRLLLEKKKN